MAGALLQDGGLPLKSVERLKAKYIYAVNSLGLIPAQAQLYASPIGVDHRVMQDAKQNLLLQYAEKNSSGKAILDNNGQPVLTPERKKLAAAVISHVVRAGSTGNEGRGHLSYVRNLNQSGPRS